LLCFLFYITGLVVNVEPVVEVIPRETEADATGDISTMDRQLADRIFFAQKETQRSHWGFPTSYLDDGETLQAAALRLAEERLGQSCQVLALSNCPIAVELHVDKKEGTYGTKTFFMRLQYYKGDVQPVTNVAEFGWLSRTELSKKAKADEGVNAAKFFHYML
jgi:8-oxo-dGTP pyrophosphatase MutT (NUDIX family)